MADRVRKGLAPATQELVAVILSARDHMRLLIDGDQDQATGDAILARLQAAIGAAGGVPDSIAAPIEQAAAGDGPTSKSGWRLRFRLPADAMANGTNPLMLLDELRDLGDCAVRALTDPSIPTNGGCFRPVSVRLSPL